LKNSLFKEIESQYKSYSSKSKSYSIINQINIKTVLVTVVLSLALYFGLFLFSNKYFFYIMFKENTFVKGLMLEDLPSMILNVEIGLFSIFFSLVILITSYIYESKSSDSSYILIKSSYIFPLIIFNLILLISFIFNEKLWDPYLQSIPLIINVILIATSFYRTLKVLSDYDYLKKTKKSVLLNKIKIYNKQLIKERLAKNYDLGKLNGRDYSIGYSIFTSDGINIKSEKKGIIVDIRIIDLKKCIRKIETKLPKTIEDAKDDITQTSIGEINAKPIQVHIKSTIGDQLSIGSSLLNITCVKEVWEQLKIETFQKEVNDCYIVNNIKHPKQNLKNVFLVIEDRLIEAIQGKNRNSIDEYVDTIIEIIGSFEDLLIYDYENASREINNIGGGWASIKYIVDTVRHTIEEAVVVSDVDIVNRTTTLPYSIIIGAVSKKDHYVFNEFIFVFPYLYHLAKKYKNDYQSNILISKAITLPVEISNLYISHFIKDARPEDITSIFNFSTQLLKMQQDTLKMMIDENESEEQFSLGLKKFSKMFDSLYFQIPEGHEQIFYFMENDKFREHIYRTDTIGKKYSDIHTNKMAIIFMLGNYIMKKKEKRYISPILSLLPNNIDYITYIYQLTNNFALENKFGWSWWGSENYDDFEVHTLDNDTGDFYIYYLLKQITNYKNTKQEYIFDESLINKIKDKDGSIIKKLDQRNPDNSKEIDKISQIKEYFEVIYKAYDLNKMRSVADGSIDQNKINDTKKEIQKGYNDHFGLIDLFDETQNNKMYSKKMKGNKIYGGYNQLLNKEPFLAQGHSIIGIRQFGLGIKDFETQRIFLHWCNDCEIVNIDKFNNKIKSSSDIPLLILSTYLNVSEMKKRLGDEYRSRWEVKSEYENSKTVGYYSYNNLNLPIIDLGFRSQNSFTNKIYAIEPSQLGRIEIEKIGDSHLKFEFFDLNLDNSLREKIIADSPSYLENIEDKELYLRGKIVFKLITTFKLNSDGMKIYEI